VKNQEGFHFGLAQRIGSKKNNSWKEFVMKKVMHATLVAVGIMPFSLFAASPDLSFGEASRESRVIAGAEQGKSTGVTADAMMPFSGSNNHLYYTSLQAYQYGNEYRTMGVGLGFRHIFDDAVYGVYGFHDWQRSENRNEYRRVNVGFERLTETWDVRAGYSWQVGQKNSIILDKGITASGYSGNDIFNRHDYDREEVFDGGSIEVGRTLGSQALRGYVGGYAYGKSIRGASARFEYQFNDRITFVAKAQRDVARGWLATGGVQYWIGKTDSDAKRFSLTDRLRDKVVRDMTVAAKVNTDFNIIEKDPRKIYFANGDVTAVSNGYEDTPTTINDAVSKASADDIVYLQSGDYTLTEALTLNQGKTLWGSSNDLTLPNGVVIKAASASSRPSLTGHEITVDGDATLSGFSMVGDGSVNMTNGINVTGGVVTIDDVVMNGTFTNGINVSGGDATLTDLSMTGSYTNGINVTGGTATIDDVSMKGSYTDGINVNGGTATINDVVLNGFYSNAGIQVSGSGATATITNSNIVNKVTTDVRAHAIFVQSGGVGHISDVTVRSLNGTGVYIADQGGTSTITNVISNGNGLYGVRVLDSKVTITGGTMDFNGSSGIWIHSGSTATIEGVTANANGENGLYVLDGSVVTVTDSLFNSNKASGIVALSSNTTITLSGANQIIGNQQVGIFASNNAAVTMNGGTVTDNIVLAVEVDINASVTITNPTSLVGDIRTDDINGASITINEVNHLTTQTTRECSISDDSGTCT
jgi:hypothetical protein